MSVGVITFARDAEVPHAGSTRIRVTWPLKYWPEAEEFQVGRRYEALIFQKAYWLEYAAGYDGVKILDLCDPDFLHDRGGCRRMMDACDAVTCSSPALTEHVATLTRTPVRCVPDRLDLATVGTTSKQHRGPTETAGWYGYAHNFAALDSLVPALLRLGIRRLIVVAEPDQPYTLPPFAAGCLTLVTRPWQEDRVCQELLAADVVLNPRLGWGAGRFKSNNKTVLAWALGLPVAHDEDELSRLMTEEARRREAERRHDEVRIAYDVRRTVDEYRALIDELTVAKERGR